VRLLVINRRGNIFGCGWLLRIKWQELLFRDFWVFLPKPRFLPELQLFPQPKKSDHRQYSLALRHGKEYRFAHRKPHFPGCYAMSAALRCTPARYDFSIIPRGSLSLVSTSCLVGAIRPPGYAQILNRQYTGTTRLSWKGLQIETFGACSCHRSTHTSAY